MAHAREVATIRKLVHVVVVNRLGTKPRLPTAIKFVRIAPSRFDDDNMMMCFKPARDGLAEALVVDDRKFITFDRGRPGIPTDYSQRKGKPHEYAVEIELTIAFEVK